MRRRSAFEKTETNYFENPLSRRQLQAFVGGLLS